MKLFYGLLVGIAMGALIQRVGASNPRMILASLRLRDLTIIKFMATTIAVASVLVYLLQLGMPMHFDVKPTYVIGVALGGLIFGAGFAIGGYCPGTCVVGIAEGRRDGWVALLGGVVGALVFTLVYRLIEAPLIKPLTLGKITWADVLHAPALGVALVMATLLLAAVRFLPTRREEAAP
ncbi:MAG TPA: YeeE/YedE thiosulfate transporter family protein [Gemmatimonadaceae bacterium]|nr:YeeE/YedE thiosulfate transporter family protein [Gemmatimonadaceae bacterium]